MDIKKLLAQQVQEALTDIQLITDKPVTVRPAVRPEFGDYQVDSMMALGKLCGENPLVLAARATPASAERFDAR